MPSPGLILLLDSDLACRYIRYKCLKSNVPRFATQSWPLFRPLVGAGSESTWLQENESVMSVSISRPNWAFFW